MPFVLLVTFASKSALRAEPATAPPSFPSDFLVHYDGGQRVGYLKGESIDLAVIVAYRDPGALEAQEDVGFRHFARTILQAQVGALSACETAAMSDDLPTLAGLLLILAYRAEPILDPDGGRRWIRLEEPLQPEEYRMRVQSRLEEMPALGASYLYHSDLFVRARVLHRIEWDLKEGQSWESVRKRFGIEDRDLPVLMDAASTVRSTCGTFAGIAIGLAETDEQARAVLDHFLARTNMRDSHNAYEVCLSLTSSAHRWGRTGIIFSEAARRAAEARTSGRDLTLLEAQLLGDPEKVLISPAAVAPSDGK